MSVAGILSSLASAPSSAQSVFQQRRSDFQQLSQALQSGDLAGAQQAFSALSSLQAANGGGAAQKNSQLAQDFSAIGQALQNGDLAGAQQAFASFQQDVQALRGQHHHHHGGGSSQAAATAPAVPEIVLNLGNSGSSPEQVTIGFSNSASGEQINFAVDNGSGTPEQLTLNLPAGSNLPEIVLNFGSATASTSNSSSGGQINVNA